GAVRVVGRERLLGEDVEPGEQAEGLVEVEIADMATAFLVEELQRQQRQQRGRRGDHLRAGIAGLNDQAIEAQLHQQGQEEEDTGDARAERSPWLQPQLPAVGDLGQFRPVSVVARAWSGTSPPAIGEEKGGVEPRRHSARKRQAIDFNAETLYPNRCATTASG